MDIEDILNEEIRLLLVIVIIATFVGFIISKIILPVSRKRLARSKRTKFSIFLKSVSGFVVFWSVVLSIYVYLILFPNTDSRVYNDSRFIVEILLVLSVIFATSRILTSFASYYMRKGRFPNTTIFNNLIRLMIFLIGFAWILRLLGVGIEPLIATFGIGAIAIALALQDTLSNLFAGLYIIATRQLNIGDYVRLQSLEEGYIEDITWRNTTIRSIQNNLIVLPNNLIASSIIINFSLPQKEMNIRIPIGVSYDSNLPKVEEIAKEEANKVLAEMNIITDFEPRVRFHTFADFSINFNLVVRINEFENQFEVQHNIVKRIHRRFKKEGIEIPFPIRTIIQKGKEISK